jgi:hypothetical protein
MKISFHSILFAFLFLTIWTVAMPTPRPYELTSQPLAVRGYYDELGARNVGDLELVPRRLPGFLRKIGNAFKKVGGAIVKGVKKVASVVSSAPIPPIPIP